MSVLGVRPMTVSGVSMRRRLSLTLTLALCAFLISCVGGTRLPARERGPWGAPIKKADLDLGFLESPTVGRGEVIAKLSRIDSGWQDPNLFWGRWAESKWGVWWFVASQGGGAGDAKRIWHAKNLLITFNDNGVIQRKQLIVNDRDLWRQLHNAIVHAPPLDSSEPEVITLEGNARSMTLTPLGLEIVVKKRRFLIAPDKIVRFSHVGSRNTYPMAYGATPNTTCHTLHFSEKTPVGKKVTFCDSNQHLFGVFQYLDRNTSKTMQWE